MRGKLGRGPRHRFGRQVSSHRCSIVRAVTSPEVFINYRTTDARFGAAACYELLTAYFGSGRVFRDCVSMAPGEVYPTAVAEALDRAIVLIVLIGPAWLASDESGCRLVDREEDWVRREIRRSLQREIQIIPVTLDGTSPPTAHELPDDIGALAYRQAMSVSHATLGPDIQRLARRIVELVPGLPPPVLRHAWRPERLVRLLGAAWRRGGLRVAIIVLVAAAVIVVTALWEERNVSGHVTTSPPIVRVPCDGRGVTVGLQNHNSHRYLTFNGPAWLADTPAPITLSGGNPPACAVEVRSATGTCLTADATGTSAAWSPCDGQTIQQWTIEDHWLSIYGEQWERLHSLQNASLCLQADEDSQSEAILLRECDAGWLQQWRLVKVP